ncbi:MAG: endonuclease domain-containing protein [bacterium]
MRTIHNLKNKEQFRKKLRNSATPQEIILWSKLKSNQLCYKFRRQHSIAKYIVDFYCPQKRLIIEIDGSQHIDSEHDKKRDRYLEGLGFRILRFWDNDVNNNLEGILLKITENLK